MQLREMCTESGGSACVWRAALGFTWTGDLREIGPGLLDGSVPRAWLCVQKGGWFQTHYSELLRLCMQTDGPSQAHQVAKILGGPLTGSGKSAQGNLGQGSNDAAPIAVVPNQGSCQRWARFVDVSVVADQYGVQRFVVASYAPVGG